MFQPTAEHRPGDNDSWNRQEQAIDQRKADICVELYHQGYRRRMRGQESMRHGQRRQHRQPDIDRRKLVFIHDREDQWHQQHKSDPIK